MIALGDFEKKVQDILNVLNSTFDIKIDATKNDEGDQVITKLVLKKPKNDGSEFMEAFIGFVGPLIEHMSSGERELVYEENKGLTIRRTN